MKFQCNIGSVVSQNVMMKFKCNVCISILFTRFNVISVAEITKNLLLTSFICDHKLPHFIPYFLICYYCRTLQQQQPGS